MDLFANLAAGFQVALTPQNLAFCLVGCILGTLIGVLPGIGPTTGVALLIPITFGLPAVTAIITMAGVYYGAMYGGSTTSILLNVPGESASTVTCLDGYQMAKNGRAGPALGIAAIGSWIAGTFAVLMITLVAQPMADFALTFGPAEYFALTFLGLTMVTGLTGKSMIKGMISVVIGLLVASVGTDAIGGSQRFTFGNIYMMDGIGFIGVAVGLFAVAEVLINLESPEARIFHRVKLSFLGMLPNREDWKYCAPVITRSSILGFLVSALPGAGATISAFLAYAVEKRISKRGARFGTGVIEGVAAPEAANNAATGGAIIHLLTLGIPGSGTTAVMMGAFLIHGLRPGPLLFQSNPEFVWGLITSMYIGNVMLLILNLPLIGMWVQLLRVPYKLMVPLILVVSAVGVYATEDNIQDVWIMFAFGVIGYLFRKVQIPPAPLILGLVLGPLVETNLRRALQLSHGSFDVFFTRPIAGVLMTIALISIFFPFLRSVWRKAGSPDIG